MAGWQYRGMRQSFRARAEARVRSAATRTTRPRVAILAALLEARSALTHHEVERRVGRGMGVDRVTIYRVLEWLVARGLAHRVSGDDRVWRFNAIDEEHAGRHAHFQCNHCGEVTCLEEVVATRNVPLPSGYRPQEVELVVKGQCAACTPARR
jgi:Fur family ferric uptake transcriptional regulator